MASRWLSTCIAIFFDKRKTQAKQTAYHNLKALALPATLHAPNRYSILVLSIIQTQGHVVVGVAQTVLVKGSLQVRAVALSIRTNL